VVGKESTLVEMAGAQVTQITFVSENFYRRGAFCSFNLLEPKIPYPALRMRGADLMRVIAIDI
jgi:hypothetical protein